MSASMTVALHIKIEQDQGSPQAYDMYELVACKESSRVSQSCVVPAHCCVLCNTYVCPTIHKMCVVPAQSADHESVDYII